jgi:hypothetical protein
MAAKKDKENPPPGKPKTGPMQTLALAADRARVLFLHKKTGERGVPLFEVFQLVKPRPPVIKKLREYALQWKKYGLLVAEHTDDSKRFTIYVFMYDWVEDAVYWAASQCGSLGHLYRELSGRDQSKIGRLMLRLLSGMSSKDIDGFVKADLKVERLARATRKRGI